MDNIVEGKPDPIYVGAAKGEPKKTPLDELRDHYSRAVGTMWFLGVSFYGFAPPSYGWRKWLSGVCFVSLMVVLFFEWKRTRDEWKRAKAFYEPETVQAEGSSSASSV